jgi:para-nitrobenzyl esterase
MILTTAYGSVRGTEHDGVHSFKALPYASPPVGPLRFRAPERPEPWEGIRDATAFGPTPPKPRYRAPIDEILPETEFPGDDYLTVNVWTRDPSPDVRAPVMVWIHGGAFVNGNSTIPAYDGHAFARDGVVFVSVNYRLGVDGFAYLPDAVPNRGLLDQVAALTWVRDNIATFGGDPANVTVFGESAGAMSVTTLLAMPSARGLFTKAITQSGAAQAAALPEDAARVTAVLGAALGVTATAETLAAIDIDTLIATQAEISAELATNPDVERFGATVLASAMAFIPVIDGDILPEHPLAAIAGGAGADVRLLTGTNTDENRLFLMPTGIAALIADDEILAMMATARLGMPLSVVSRYRRNRPDATPGEVLAALMTDAFFRNSALAVAEARSSTPTWVYEFAWPGAKHGMGACHALEIGFVFDNLGADGLDGIIATEPPQALADAVHGAWIAFATDGTPGWEPFDDAYPVMIFDGDGARLVRDPRSDERLSWAEARAVSAV